MIFFFICNYDYFINNTFIWIIATSFDSFELNLLHYKINILFVKFIFELIIVQKEMKTRVDANVFFSKSKKRRFIVLKQKKIIETFKFDYTFFIIFIYRLFELYHVYMTFWKFVQLFLFFCNRYSIYCFIISIKRFIF